MGELLQFKRPEVKKNPDPPKGMRSFFDRIEFAFASLVNEAETEDLYPETIRWFICPSCRYEVRELVCYEADGTHGHILVRGHDDACQGIPEGL